MAIQINKLYKKYNKQIIFANFNYQFLDNQFYLIYGYSGCGKTTLVNMIMKLVPVDSGTIKINNIDINELTQKDLQRNIAYMTQDSYFIDYLTIREHLQINSECYNLALEYLEKFQLLDVLDRYPNTLSGGEKQRINIIRELSIGKKIFILDEPTSSLDYENKIKVFSLLEQISKDTLVICVSHDEQAKMFAHHVLDLNNKDELYKNQNKKFTQDAKFKEESNLNLYPIKKLVSRKKDKEKKSRIILCGIMIAFTLIMSFFLNPTDKLINSLGSKYHLNYLNVEVKNEDVEEFNNFLKKNKSVTAVVYQYGHGGDYHVPIIEGSVDISDTDIVNALIFPTLPLSDSFYYKNHLAAGKYFDDAYEIMLGYEYALKLEPNIESLIGKTIELETGKGIEKFTVSGIFDRFGNEELEYFKGGYDINNLNRLAFFNEKYSILYLNDNKLSNREKQNPYRSYFTIYFNDFSELIKFQEQYRENEYHSTDSIFVHPIESNLVSQINQMKLMEMFSLPVSIIAILISLLFYIQINYIKLEKNIKEFGIYRYFGYSWKEIRNAYVSYYSVDLLKMVISSSVVSYILMFVINYLNTFFNFYKYTIFTVSVLLLLLPLTLFISGVFMNFLMIRKFRKSNWYNDIRKKRDLL